MNYRSLPPSRSGVLEFSETNPSRKVLGVRVLCRGAFLHRAGAAEFLLYGDRQRNGAGESGSRDREARGGGFVSALLVSGPAEILGRGAFGRGALQRCNVRGAARPPRPCRGTSALSGPSVMLDKSGDSLSELQREGKRIQELIARIDDVPDPSSRAMLEECIGSLLRFTGRGWPGFSISSEGRVPTVRRSMTAWSTMRRCAGCS